MNNPHQDDIDALKFIIAFVKEDLKYMNSPESVHIVGNERKQMLKYFKDRIAELKKQLVLARRSMREIIEQPN